MQLCTDLVYQQIEHKTTKTRLIYTVKPLAFSSMPAFQKRTVRMRGM